MAVAAVQFADLVLERLALCGLDMGLERTSKTAPQTKLDRDDLPFAYGLMGGFFAPVNTAAGIVKVPRTYIQRILIYPIGGGINDIDDGAESNVRALEWIDRAHFYYAARPNLQIEISELFPDGYAELDYCEGVMGTTDSGLVSRPAPGGLQCAAIDVSINIIMAARVNRVASPYRE